MFSEEYTFMLLMNMGTGGQGPRAGSRINLIAEKLLDIYLSLYQNWFSSSLNSV